MRISSGIYRNRIINAPNNNDATRPTTDKTRQAIFNVIRPYIYDSKVLDLFAGSGAMGIEALSNEAKHITFIDNDIQAIKAIKDNLTSLKINKDEYEIIKDDYHIIKSINSSFDIIFMDPPYRLNVFDEILKIIEDNNLLNKHGIIVYESNIENSEIDDIEGYAIKKYHYGISYVTILFKKAL